MMPSKTEMQSYEILHCFCANREQKIISHFVSLQDERSIQFQYKPGGQLISARQVSEATVSSEKQKPFAT